MLRYRDNMSDEELAAFMRECEMWDECYADAVETDESRDKDFDDSVPDMIRMTDEEECFDPIRDGWVDKQGRP